MQCKNDTEKVEKIKDEAFPSPDSSILSVGYGYIKSQYDNNDTRVKCKTTSNKSTCSDKYADEIVKTEQDADEVVKSEPVEIQNKSAIHSKQLFSFSLLDVDKDLLIDKIEFKTGISNITDITLTNSSESNAENIKNIPEQTSNIISNIQPPLTNLKDSYKFKMPSLKKFVKNELLDGIEGIIFHCNMCIYKTQFSYSLKNHLKNEHFSTLHLCDQCKTLFHNEKSLSSHNNCCHRSSNSFKCSKCTFFADSYSALARHKMTLHRIRYNCNKCNYTSVLSTSLKQHQVTQHYNEEEHSNIVYSCSICNKKFIYISMLDIHSRKHTGKYPYVIVCKLCDFVAYSQGRLTSHELNHHIPKQFCCSLCTKKFSIESDLDKHLTIHSNFKCSYCSFTDCTRALLAGHHKANHSDKLLIMNQKPYQCDSCYTGFRRKSSLKVHNQYQCKGRNKSEINSITKSVPNTNIEVNRIKTDRNVRKMDPVKKADSSIYVVSNKTVFICKSCNEHFSAEKVLNRHLIYCKFHNP